MIITGIFLFLLGTKLGQAATKTEVKYQGPEKITVTEEKDDNIILPGLGCPPFAPKFFHQGSNFYFNPQFVLPEGIIPTIERVIPFQTNEYSNIPIVTPELTSDIVIENEPIVEMIVPELQSVAIPQFEIEESLPQRQFEIERLPSIGVPLSSKLPAIELQPPFPVLVEEPSNLSVPCEDIEINNIIPGLPTLIEEQFQPPNELFISGVNVHVNEIPPPPELPPLIISEIPKPVIVKENNRVILVPSAPEFKDPYPASVVVSKKPLNLMDCTQSIILDRFLPKIAFENDRMVELISIPAAKRAPVVSSIIY